MTMTTDMGTIMTTDMGDISTTHEQPAVEAIRPSPDVAVLVIHGQADLHSAPELREQLHRVIDDGAFHVVADLTDATFVLVGQFRVIAKAAGVHLLLAAALLLFAELAGFPVTLRFTLVTETVFAHTGFLLAELVELALPVSF